MRMLIVSRGLSLLIQERSISARERRHTIVLEAGLYLLRYQSTHALNDPPFIEVRPSDDDRGGISLLAGPRTSPDRLSSPGVYILVQAEYPGALNLRVCASRPGGSLDAEVRLERIVTATHQDDSVLPPSHQTISSRPSEGSSSVNGLEILAHVSHRGDTISRHGEWICGPDLPMPIEGIEIQWPNKPEGLELFYSVASGRRNQHRREIPLGQFAGTRGKSAPLLGLNLGIKGARARDFELRCDVMFLGSPIVTKHGSELTFSGPTGREPLVGFRLSVAAIRKDHTRVRTKTKPKWISANQVGKVRVYRPASIPAT